MEVKLPTFNSVFSIDCVIFGFEAGELKILLIERNEEPFKDWLALPGYIVEQDESIDDAAERILYELTGLRDLHMQQLQHMPTAPEQEIEILFGIADTGHLAVRPDKGEYGHESDG